MKIANKLIIFLILIGITFSFILNYIENNPQVKYEKTDVQIFFCPEEDCKQEIIKLVKESTKSINCMIYSFTDNEIGNELIEAKKRNIEIKIIIESEQITKYSIYENLKNNKISIIKDKNNNLMHNKFCVFDEKKVFTGSVNLTNNGLKFNNENLTIINNSEIAEKFNAYFLNYWKLWT